jgi:hypothetical protein
MRKIEALLDSSRCYCGRYGIIEMIRFGTTSKNLAVTWVSNQCNIGVTGMRYSSKTIHQNSSNKL